MFIIHPVFRFHLHLSLVKHNLTRRQKMYLRTCAPTEDSDQPAHSRSLIRILIGWDLDSQGCIKNLQGFFMRTSFFMRKTKTDQVAGMLSLALSLRWAHMWKGTFSRWGSNNIDLWGIMRFHGRQQLVLSPEGKRYTRKDSLCCKKEQPFSFSVDPFQKLELTCR